MWIIAVAGLNLVELVYIPLYSVPEQFLDRYLYVLVCTKFVVGFIVFYVMMPQIASG